MTVLLGAPLAQQILLQTKSKIEKLNRPPVLNVVCSDKTQPYYKGILKDSEFCGVEIAKKWMPKSKLDGIISLDRDYSPPYNLNMDGGRFPHCTAEAVMRMFEFYGVLLREKNVCVIGASGRVGIPLTKLLLLSGANVTTCNSKTKDLYWRLIGKDILISCAGNAGIDLSGIATQWMTVVDIGHDLFNTDECNALVPPVGGVGLVTRAVLMEHVYKNAIKRGATKNESD